MQKKKIDVFNIYLKKLEQKRKLNSKNRMKKNERNQVMSKQM